MKIIDRHSSLKEIIVELLSYEIEPISAIKIHNRIKKIGRNNTYQGTYKIIKILENEKILHKYQNNTYILNFEWIKNQKKYFSNLLNNNNNNKETKEINKTKELRIYKCKNLIEMDLIWCEFLEKGIRNDKSKITTWEGAYAWWIHGNLQNENLLIDNLKDQKVKSYLSITSNNFLNNISKKYYEEKGCEVKFTNSFDNLQTYIGTAGKYLFKLEIDEKLSLDLKKIYSSKKYDEFNITKFVEIINSDKYKIILEIFENEFLSDAVKQKIVSKFN